MSYKQSYILQERFYFSKTYRPKFFSIKLATHQHEASLNKFRHSRYQLVTTDKKYFLPQYVSSLKIIVLITYNTYTVRGKKYRRIPHFFISIDIDFFKRPFIYIHYEQNYRKRVHIKIPRQYYILIPTHII